MHLYDSRYLDKARNTMAVMLDFAVHYLHRDPDAFFELFINTGNAALFERGDVRTLAGTSGVELAYRVLSDSGSSFEMPAYRYTNGRSREFWAGWSLADYQYEKALSFEEISGHISLGEIIGICEGFRSATIKRLSEGLSWMDTVRVPDHMSDEDQKLFADRLDALIDPAHSNKTRLQKLRLLNGMSQSRLASESGVPVRTIQQYEQRQKDINMARFAQIMKLAAVLNCEPCDLLEQSPLN
ncbi:MAG: helix-turn-helix transcriptional regulator [Mogibacterium sp.]|nr:helix-turn-helix transcriptional regulator [Mogibacterium sp.]